MTKKTAKKPGPRADTPGRSAEFPSSAVPVALDIAQASIADFSAERDDFLEQVMPPNAMPEDEEAFYARDPFSADYADFLKGKGDLRRTLRVNGDLREDLLARPHLMHTPEEAAHRGAAAVWRSLRDQLHNESLAVMDGSDREELLMLQRDLEARKAVVDSVGKGLEGLLKRLKQRLTEVEAAPPEPVQTAPEPARALAEASADAPVPTGAAAARPDGTARAAGKKAAGGKKSAGGKKAGGGRKTIAAAGKE